MGLVPTSLEDEIFIEEQCAIPCDRRLEASATGCAGQVAGDHGPYRQERCHDHGGSPELLFARWEIIKAMKETVKEAMENGASYEEVEKMLTEENFEKHLETNFMPDPELLIRTGGELRISNYLLWQIAYSELYFCDTYLPDFNEECLHKVIESYQSRQRRFAQDCQAAQVEAEEEKCKGGKGRKNRYYI